MMPGVAWKLTVRAGPKVQKSRYDGLDQALEALEGRARELAEDVSPHAIDVKVRRFEPADQIAARLELAGPERLMPSVRAGLDVHGDGSTEAYLGRVKREVVGRGRGEKSYRALRKAVTAAARKG